MKFCKDCKHASEFLFPFDTCSRSVRADGFNPLNGEEIRVGWKSTTDEREFGHIMARLTGSCGKEGRFWEGKL